MQNHPRKEVAQISHAFEIDGFSPDSRVLAYTIQSWGAGGGYYLADPLTGRTLLYAGANSLAFTREGGRVAGEDGAGTITFWETRTWKVVNRLRTRLKRVQSLSLSADGTLLAAAAHDGVRVFDVSTGWEVMQCSSGESPRGVTFVPNASELAVATRKRVELWHVPARELLLLRAAFRRLQH